MQRDSGEIGRLREMGAGVRGTTTDDTIVISMMNTSHQRRRLEVGMIM